MDERRDIYQVLAELELCSHVSALEEGYVAANKSKSAEEKGGKQPSGGVDREEDRHRLEAGEDPGAQRVLRSASYFRRQLTRGRPPHFVLREAEAALAAWKRQPAVKGDPVKGDPGWKRWVSESELSSSRVAEIYGVSKRYVNRIRALYREAA